jgi:hypothetical protein
LRPYLTDGSKRANGGNIINLSSCGASRRQAAGRHLNRLRRHIEYAGQSLKQALDAKKSRRDKAEVKVLFAGFPNRQDAEASWRYQRRCFRGA